MNLGLFIFLSIFFSIFSRLRFSSLVSGTAAPLEPIWDRPGVGLELLHSEGTEERKTYSAQENAQDLVASEERDLTDAVGSVKQVASAGKDDGTTSRVSQKYSERMVAICTNAMM